MQVREMPPFAPVLMESTRAIGYSLEAAIADIIDNSIAAKADKIQLFFFPVADAYVSILDNGSGMDDAQIDVAMQYGSKSPTDMRDATDLGRYGLGLKTASLSQCRVLTVISKQGNTIIGRRWDLDYVIGTGRWSLLVLEQDDIAQAPHIEDLKEQENGTLVIWQTLDRLLMGEVDYEKSLGRKMDDVRQHLGLVFHRYLLGEAGIKRLEISFNGVKINAAELKPKAFVMENVSMLKSDVHRFYMEEGDVETVKKYKIPVKSTPLHLLDAEYMFEGALDILKDQQKIQQYLWPEQHYFELNVIYKATKNLEKMKSTLEKHKKKLCATAGDYAKSSDNSHISNVSKSAFQAILAYYSGELSVSALKSRIEPAILIQRMLSKAQEIHENHIVVDAYSVEGGIAAIIRSFAVYDYLEKVLQAPENGYILDKDVLCAADYGAPQKRMRFVVMGIKRSISPKVALPKGRFDADEYRTVRDAIGDLEDVEPVVDLEEDKNGIYIEHKENLGALASDLRDSEVLRNHMVTKTTAVAMERFRALKQGQNFHSLDESLKTNTYTDAARTQNTIYLRLNYDEPSGTVVNVRKSMWIHPTLNRAISVREAARLQTFPDSFVFCGSKDKQYQQVGNAVPPIMAKSIAKKLARILKDNLTEDKTCSG